jgi:hypothetical protein
MKVTYHAAERFIQRILGKLEYTKKEVLNAKEYLTNLFKNVVTHRQMVVVPGFSNYVAVVKENNVVTILEKNFSTFY